MLLLGENSNYNIFYNSNITETPAFELFNELYKQSINDGHSSKDVFLNLNFDKVDVVYCCDEVGDVVAGIAFQYRPIFNEGWILFTFTHKNHRGKGLNGMLRPYVENKLIMMGAEKVCSYIHPNNTSSLKASLKAGSTIEYYKTVKLL